MLYPLLIILGPTASGKTHLATRVAEKLGGEIISADSRQVYKNMDIGTGKDLSEYIVGDKKIVYHLIDNREAGDKYNVNEYQKDFADVLMNLRERNTIPIVCGGTGFYIYSILKGHAFTSIPVDADLRLDLEKYATDKLLEKFKSVSTPYSEIADTSTRKRLIRAIEISEYLLKHPESDHFSAIKSETHKSLIFGLNPPTETRRERITQRLKDRLKNGLIEEVEYLLKNGLTAEQLIYYGLEYKFVTLYLRGAMNYSDMCQRLETEIHRFAKRQMTFYRKMEKDGIQINWLDPFMVVQEQIDLVREQYSNFCNT